MFVLDLIHRLIPIMGIQGRDGTPGGGRVTPSMRQELAELESSGSGYSWDAQSTMRLTQGIGQLANLFTANQFVPDASGRLKEPGESDFWVSAGGGAVSGAAALSWAGPGGAVAGAAIGFGLGAMNYFSADEEYRRQQQELRRQRREQWAKAVDSHISRVRSYKSHVSAKEKELSMAKVKRLATAAGMADIAIDRQVIASTGRGSYNLQSLQSAAASANTLDQRLSIQEDILDNKLRKLRKIKHLAATEIMAEREDYRGDEGEKAEISTSAFDQLEREVAAYESGDYNG